MREIRPSGSEGGGAETNRLSLPLSLCDPSGVQDLRIFARPPPNSARSLFPHAEPRMLPLSRTPHAVRMPGVRGPGVSVYLIFGQNYDPIFQGGNLVTS